MLGEQNEPVFLQIKEARASVLASRIQKSPWGHNGERVVVGQRVIQASSDMLLGWSRGPNGREYYVRQLRDMKMSVDISTVRRPGLTLYGVLCGQNWHGHMRRQVAPHGSPAILEGRTYLMPRSGATPLPMRTRQSRTTRRSVRQRVLAWLAPIRPARLNNPSSRGARHSINRVTM
jgi:hypothetical protein